MAPTTLDTLKPRRPAGGSVGVRFYCRHSQYFFWYFLYTSANNLVYLAYDRYRAVTAPLHYKDISR